MDLTKVGLVGEMARINHKKIGQEVLNHAYKTEQEPHDASDQ